MPCYHPLPGWYGKERNATTGKRPVVFRFNEGLKDRTIDVPCGRCIGCRLERARQWAVRCMHEAQMHRQNCFVTLTYNDGQLSRSSIDGESSVATLRPRDFVLFMKKLRWKYGAGIRFFQCGEYGEKLQRPHHHALLFNHDFTDKQRMPGTDGDRNPIYTSRELDDLWGFGFASIGNVTFQSAGYVARYALKKVRGPAAAAHYGGRQPEYLTMSRRPGIGATWIDKYHGEVYPADEVISNGHQAKPPRYYDDRIDKKNERMLKEVRIKRAKQRRKDKNSTGKRLLVRETVKEAAVKTLTRNMEKER